MKVKQNAGVTDSNVSTTKPLTARSLQESQINDPKLYKTDTKRK